MWRLLDGLLETVTGLLAAIVMVPVLVVSFFALFAVVVNAVAFLFGNTEASLNWAAFAFAVPALLAIQMGISWWSDKRRNEPST